MVIFKNEKIIHDTIERQHSIFGTPRPSLLVTIKQFYNKLRFYKGGQKNTTLIKQKYRNLLSSVQTEQCKFYQVPNNLFKF